MIAVVETVTRLVRFADLIIWSFITCDLMIRERRNRLSLMAHAGLVWRIEVATYEKWR